MMRIDAYRAMSSSAYLWLATHDPILVAIQLSTEMEKCSDVEKQLKVSLKVPPVMARLYSHVAMSCGSLI